MTVVNLLCSESLRVIGQDLTALSINDFKLGKRGTEYTLAVEGRLSDRALTDVKTWILDRSQFSSESPNTIQFSTSNVLWAYVARAMNRKTSNGLTDLNQLSLLLRGLGDFLDKKQSEDFLIFWSRNTVKVVYNRREENFTLVNLYDLGTSMYLKRSARTTEPVQDRYFRP
jgi:hypothetical protein